MTGALAFACRFNPARIVFGTGSAARLAEELRAAGRSRALILSTPFQKDAAEALAARLGGLAAGVFAEAAMHTPVGVTERAMAAFAAAGRIAPWRWGAARPSGSARRSRDATTRCSSWWPPPTPGPR